MITYDVIDEFKDLSHKLKEHFQEIFDSLPFAYASVRRIYPDGSTVWIVTDSSVLPNYFTRNLPLLRASYEYPTSTASKQGVYIWEESLPVINNSFLAGMYNIVSGISLYEHFPMFSDVMAFAVDPDCLLSPFNLYASVLPMLWKFRTQWYKDHGNFLNVLHSQKKLIPNNHSSKPKDLKSQALLKQFQQNPISIIHPSDGQILLKPEEALLMRWINEGKTIHEIKDLSQKSYGTIKNNLTMLRKKIRGPFYNFSHYFDEVYINF